MYRIDAWINKGSGWIIESIESQYINISTHRPLVGRSYIDLPIELKHPKKGLINIKNNDYDEINFLQKKKIFKRLKCKTIFALMCLVMKTIWFFQFTFLIKNLKILWIYCF